MGIGDEPFGDLPIGDSATFDPVPARAQRQKAIHFDGTTRDFPMVDGRYVEIHTVDAAVQSALLFLEGSVPASPTQGATLDKVRNPFSPRAPIEVEQRVRAALQALILNGDIELISVLTEPVASGMKVEVKYVNNRLPGRPERVVTAIL